MIRLYFTFIFSLFSLIHVSRTQELCESALTISEVAEIVVPFRSGGNGLTVYEHFGDEVGFFYEVRNTCPNLINGNPLPTGVEPYSGTFLTCSGDIICNYGIDRPLPCEASLNGIGLDLTKATTRRWISTESCEYNGIVLDFCSNSNPLNIFLPQSRAEYPNLPGLPPDPVCSFNNFQVNPNDVIDQNAESFRINPSTRTRYELTFPSASTDCAPLSFVYTIDPTACEDDMTSPPLPNDVFDQYPFLNDIVDVSNCSGAAITVYVLNNNIFLLVETPEAIRLYLADGTLWCTNSDILSCVETYGLVDMVDEWICPGDIFATICPGDPLPNLRARFAVGEGRGRICGPQGPVGGPPPTCICQLIGSVTISPQEGVISELIDGQFFTVAPTVTTTYTITSRTAIPAPDLPCEAQEFIDTFTIVVKSPSECEEQDCICPTVALPVCGEDGITYINACRAACAGVEVIAEGECSPNNFEAITSQFPFVNELVDDTNCRGVSIAVYNSDGTFFIYIETENNGTLYLADGSLFCQAVNGSQCLDNNQLSEPLLSWQCDNPCICSRELDPVCGSDGNTYTNACQAACAGVDIIAQGECEACQCTEQFDPVCGSDGITYDNSCFAICAGVLDFTQDPCNVDCGCDDVFAPVCGEDGLTYSNECMANCFGIQIIANGECSSSGDCDQESGIIVFENCDDGRTFFFVRTPTGELLDLYFDDGIEFEVFEGQNVIFDYRLADFESPCSIADRAIVATCIIDISGTDQICSQDTGTIVFEPCDDGRTFFFIRSASGELLDLYFEDGVEFEVFEGQQVSFDYVLADFESPCSIADRAIVATCITDITEQADCSRDTGTIVFERCDDGRTFFFIRISSGELLDLYFDDGIEFEVFRGQRVSFDYVLADFESPCSIASRAIVATCITDITADDCTSNSGTFFHDECTSNGLSLLLRRPDGSVIDPYFIANFTFDAQEGMTVQFNFEFADFVSPCRNNIQAVAITCMEEIIAEEDDIPGLNEFPWLANQIDFETCVSGAFYEIYEVPGFAFVYYDNGEDAVLFDQDGNLYCTDSEILSCREVYVLSNPVVTWNCELDNSALIADVRSNVSSSFSNLSVFPNPATDQIQIAGLSSDVKNMRIINLFGSVMWENNGSPTEQVDVSRFSSGIYILAIRSTDGESKTIKFSVQ